MYTTLHETCVPDVTRAEYDARLAAVRGAMAVRGVDLFMVSAPETSWVDLSGLIDSIRMIKSPTEQALMRRAAKVSDAGATAAIEAIREQASERQIAAACEHAMISAGGTFPGFGPFIRSTTRLGEEHGTWTDQRFAAGDTVFIELSGCVARYHAPLGR